jgi:hypothetical protein
MSERQQRQRRQPKRARGEAGGGGDELAAGGWSCIGQMTESQPRCVRTPGGRYAFKSECESSCRALPTDLLGIIGQFAGAAEMARLQTSVPDENVRTRMRAARARDTQTLVLDFATRMHEAIVRRIETGIDQLITDLRDEHRQLTNRCRARSTRETCVRGWRRRPLDDDADEDRPVRTVAPARSEERGAPMSTVIPGMTGCVWGNRQNRCRASPNHEFDEAEKGLYRFYAGQYGDRLAVAMTTYDDDASLMRDGKWDDLPNEPHEEYSLLRNVQPADISRVTSYGDRDLAIAHLYMSANVAGFSTGTMVPDEWPNVIQSLRQHPRVISLQLLLWCDRAAQMPSAQQLADIRRAFGAMTQLRDLTLRPSMRTQNSIYTSLRDNARIVDSLRALSVRYPREACTFDFRFRDCSPWRNLQVLHFYHATKHARNEDEAEHLRVPFVSPSARTLILEGSLNTEWDDDNIEDEVFDNPTRVDMPLLQQLFVINTHPSTSQLELIGTTGTQLRILDSWIPPRMAVADDYAAADDQVIRRIVPSQLHTVTIRGWTVMPKVHARWQSWLNESATHVKTIRILVSDDERLLLADADDAPHHVLDLPSSVRRVHVSGNLLMTAMLSVTFTGESPEATARNAERRELVALFKGGVPRTRALLEMFEPLRQLGWVARVARADDRLSKRARQESFALFDHMAAAATPATPAEPEHAD